MGELLSQNQRWDTFQLSHANSHSHRWVLPIICETMAIEDGSHSWDGNLFIPLLAHVCTWEHPIGGLENYWWDISFCPIKMSPFANTRAILGTEWEHADQDETVLGLFLIPAVWSSFRKLDINSFHQTHPKAIMIVVSALSRSCILV